MFFHRIPLEPDALKDLQTLIERAENTVLYPTCSFGNIMYHSEHQMTELYLKTTPIQKKGSKKDKSTSLNN